MELAYARQVEACPGLLSLVPAPVVNSNFPAGGGSYSTRALPKFDSSARNARASILAAYLKWTARIGAVLMCACDLEAEPRHTSGAHTTSNEILFVLRYVPETKQGHISVKRPDS